LIKKIFIITAVRDAPVLLQYFNSNLNL